MDFFLTQHQSELMNQPVANSFDFPAYPSPYYDPVSMVSRSVDFSAQYAALRSIVMDFVRDLKLPVLTKQLKEGRVTIIPIELTTKTDQIREYAKRSMMDTDSFMNALLTGAFRSLEDVLTCPAVQEMQREIVELSQGVRLFILELIANRGSGFSFTVDGNFLARVGVLVNNHYDLWAAFLNAFLEVYEHANPQSDLSVTENAYDEQRQVSLMEFIETSFRLEQKRGERVRALFKDCAPHWQRLSANELQAAQSDFTYKVNLGHKLLQELYSGSINPKIHYWNANHRAAYCTEENKDSISCHPVFHLKEDEELDLDAWYRLALKRDLHSYSIQRPLREVFQRCLGISSFQGCLKKAFGLRSEFDWLTRVDSKK